MSTWKNCPLETCAVPELHRVEAAPSSALAGRSALDDDEAVATHPARESGASGGRGVPNTLNSVIDHQYEAVPVWTIFMYREACGEKVTVTTLDVPVPEATGLPHDVPFDDTKT